MSISSNYARELMGQAMDARALNQWQNNALADQAHALVNDTPETDCAMDHVAVLVAGGLTPSAAMPLVKCIHQAATANADIYISNETEGVYETELCGALDDVAKRTADAERNGGSPVPTVKEIGTTLRWALPIIFEPAGHTIADRLRADEAAMSLVDTIPAGQLFTDTVRKEINGTNYGRLIELHAVRHEDEEMVA